MSSDRPTDTRIDALRSPNLACRTQKLEEGQRTELNCGHRKADNRAHLQDACATAYLIAVAPPIQPHAFNRHRTLCRPRQRRRDRARSCAGSARGKIHAAGRAGRAAPAVAQILAAWLA